MRVGPPTGQQVRVRERTRVWRGEQGIGKVGPPAPALGHSSCPENLAGRAGTI